MGTIFSVVKKITRGSRGEMEDMLQPGRRQVASGYVIYGSSTMLVYTTGQGAHGFTLDPSLGEFLLSHPNIRTPDVGRYLSVNDSYHSQWETSVQSLMSYYRGQDGNRQPMSTRYVGSLVADCLGTFSRRTLGLRQQKDKRGKLRYLRGESPRIHRRAGRRSRAAAAPLRHPTTERTTNTAIHGTERRRCRALDAGGDARSSSLSAVARWAQ